MKLTGDQKLNIQCRNQNLSERNFEIIQKDILQYKNLKELNIDLSYSTFRKEDFQKFFNIFSKFKLLKKLEFNFTNNNVKNQVITQLGSQLALCLSLETLILNLLNQIEDEGLHNLRTSLTCCKNIQSFEANFGQENKFSGQGLAGLSQGLKQIKNLESFHIQLQEFKLIFFEAILELTLRQVSMECLNLLLS
ncbi:hypothetical protein ABPG72_016376 [Tetrahymena utriculariae]